MIELEPDQLNLIKDILKAELPDCRVLAFGSRVQNRSWKFSDLDLAIEGIGKIDWQKIEALKDVFALSDLPIMIDVLDLKAIEPSFRKIIETGPCEVIQTGNL